MINIAITILGILAFLFLLALGVAYLISLEIKKRVEVGRFDIIDKAIRFDQYTNKELMDIYTNHYEEISIYTQEQLCQEIKDRKINISDYVPDIY